MTTRPQVLLRADGNAEIGMGHVIRSLSLGAMLTAEFECILYTRFMNELISAEAEKAGIVVHQLSVQEHLKEFLDITEPGQIIVLDNYFFDQSYQEKIRVSGGKLVCIDDMHYGHFVADLIINHSPGVRPADYSCESYTRLLLGLDYVLLRKSFLADSENHRMPTQLKRIMVCFGGSDPENFTLRYSKQLLEMEGVEVEAVVGASYRHQRSLQAIGDPRFSIHHNLSQEQLKSVILHVDLALVPCSSILMEVIALQCPFLTGYYVANQQGIEAFFSSKDSRVSLGDLRQAVVNESILRQLLPYPLDLSSLIDRRSGQRLLNEFKRLL